MDNITHKLGFGELREALRSGGLPRDFRPFVSDEFVMLTQSPFILGLIAPDTPYIMEDVRIVYVAQGEATINVNLLDREARQGDILIIHYGAVVQPMRISHDLRLMAMMVSPALLRIIVGDSTPQLLRSETGVTFVRHTDEEGALALHMLRGIWALVQGWGFQPAVMHPALRMYVEYLDMLHQRNNGAERSRASHAEHVFNRFVALINEHCHEYHSLDYYAGEMCLTSHYLGSLVKQRSGMTAKEWIDRALVTKAKVMLKSTDLQAAQIAAQLGFANASFFSKFFKRLTSQTPQGYREA